MERRTEWDSSSPRERREDDWPDDAQRQRRRPRWGEFRSAYPRIVTGMALGAVALLAVDAALLVQRTRYVRELNAIRVSMSTLERERADALVALADGRGELQAAVARQQAIAERGLNLAVSLEEGTMHLQREGARLRTMRVEVGPELDLAGSPGASRIVPPLGRRLLARVVDADYSWRVPGWLAARRGAGTPEQVVGGLGPIALILDDGTVIYSRPSRGPLADDAYVLPGAVRAGAEDLRTIRENLSPGVPVYFH